MKAGTTHIEGRKLVCSACGTTLMGGERMDDTHIWFSCPVYMNGKTKDVDEHTSWLIEMEDGDEEKYF